MAGSTVNRSNWILAFALVMGAAIVYILTLAPTVTSEDSGEFIAAAYGWGVAHPPGYPLWTMLCGTFLRIVPFGSVAWRCNLFSALCTALSLAPLFAAILELGLRRRAAVVGAAVWACSGTLWAQSVITEVYGMNALFLTTSLWLVLRWNSTRKEGWLLALSLVLGLGIAHHHSIAFFALALVAWILTRRRLKVVQGRLIGRCAVVAGVGLLPNAYLPLAASHDPVMNWGDPSSLDRLVKHVTRSQYGSTAPLKVVTPRSVQRYGRQLAYAGGVLTNDLAWPVAIAAGLALLLAGVHTAQSNDQARSVMLLAAFVAASCGGLFLIMSNIDLDRVFRFAMRVFLIPLSLSAVLPLAYGVSWLIDRGPSRAIRTGATLIGCALPVVTLFHNWSRCDYSNYWYAHDHAHSMLASMLPNAMLFPTGDHTTFPLLYVTLVEDHRSDVTLADKYGYIDNAVLEDVARKSNTSVRLTSDADKTEFLIRRARRPVYFSTKRSSPVPGASVVAVGMGYHLLPEHKPLDRDTCWNHIAYRNVDQPSVMDLGASYILSEYYMFKALDALRRQQHDVAKADLAEAGRVAHGLKKVLNNIGSILGEHGMLTEAVPYFENARHLDAQYVMPRWNLARMYATQGMPDKAIAVLQELMAIAPEDPRFRALHDRLTDG
jgi:hypothetical protein